MKQSVCGDKIHGFDYEDKGSKVLRNVHVHGPTSLCFEGNILTDMHQEFMCDDVASCIKFQPVISFIAGRVGIFMLRRVPLWVLHTRSVDN
jgi:hypothetical protein